MLKSNLFQFVILKYFALPTAQAISKILQITHRNKVIKGEARMD